MHHFGKRELDEPPKPPPNAQANKKINLEMSQDNPNHPFILQNY